MGERRLPARLVGGALNDEWGRFLDHNPVSTSLEGKPEVEDLEKVVAVTLEACATDEPMELTVVVTTDETIRDYNNRYLGRDRPTDVLAFGTEVSGPTDVFVYGPIPVRYLGDVMVSYDRAVEQAPEYGHSATEELHQLVVHGVLHLLGYDDSDRCPAKGNAPDGRRSPRATW